MRFRTKDALSSAVAAVLVDGAMTTGAGTACDAGFSIAAAAGASSARRLRKGGGDLSVEIFGVELVVNVFYSKTDTKLSIFWLEMRFPGDFNAANAAAPDG